MKDTLDLLNQIKALRRSMDANLGHEFDILVRPILEKILRDLPGEASVEVTRTLNMPH